ncbi:hypothetical protein D9V84_03030 [Bacteroidetes/Chlorobi group bacterium Naka2016]|jgi:hypothetical protein|nr:MAG: hypothetical protein D9V84_03030 [Bacteroidetes/Chlorobi group bacterium Naka2016]
MKRLFALLVFALIFSFCTNNQNMEMKRFIDKATVNKTVKALVEKYGESERPRIERSIKQMAEFWTEDDGSKKEFFDFCLSNFVPQGEKLDQVFERLSNYFEVISGHFNKITLELNRQLHLDLGEILPVDLMFAGYDPSANLINDFFKNKIAFYVILNFPNYSLEEKNTLGSKWSRKEWAFARLGDIFISRVPSEYLQKISEVSTKADSYISQYNIFVGNLVDDNFKTYFPKDKKLISHWNLRDEIKSQYGKEDGLFKQKMIYQVMKHIINQTIPENVINNPEYSWNPFKNKVFKDGKEVPFKPEPNTRYEHLLNNFLVRKAVDKFYPQYPTYISRKFDLEFEISEKEIENLFVELLSSPTVKKVANLIQKRLNRPLEPFDIWYDGFKARSLLDEAKLTEITRSKYPNNEAFAKDLPNILMKLGFSSDLANFIASKVEVDPARGAGHAWGAQMRSEKAHLRTRIPPEGMDYKGYNIAIHEFGHNVEQTLTLQKVDYYMLNGVPNTAFTEAMAFIFQKRDLQLLGITNPDPNAKYLDVLDNFWSAYEIMGVALVDMYVWNWLYKNPNATPEELKQAVISIAKDVWNKYYAPVFGIKDEPILAIYSHMIDYPLYLPAYPLGHVIEFQIEKYIEGKNFAEELYRILTQGRLTPQIWMRNAVGSDISVKPMIESAEEALKYIN